MTNLDDKNAEMLLWITSRKKLTSTRRRNNGPGRLVKELARVLSEHFGFPVEPTDVIVAKGRYRSDRRFDVCRWEVLVSGKANYQCWETVTQFLKDYKKHGKIVTDDGIISIDCNAVKDESDA